MKSKPTTAVAVLTQKDLNDEGIKTQLTQNDVLEIIVEEKYKEFDERLKYFSKRPKEITGEFHNIVKQYCIDQLDKYIKKHKLPFTKEQILKFNIMYFSYLDKGNNPYVRDFPSGGLNYLCEASNSRYLNMITPYRENKKMLLSYSNGSLVPIKLTDEMKIQVSFTHTTDTTKVHDQTIGYKSRVSEYVEFGMTFKLTDVKGLSKVMKDAENYVKEAEEFMEIYKDQDVSYDGILRQVKTKFNKELIKTTSPKLKQKIKESFGLTI